MQMVPGPQYVLASCDRVAPERGSDSPSASPSADSVRAWNKGLADIARHVKGCHVLQERGSELRWMTWWLADIARHVIRCHSTQETRVQTLPRPRAAPRAHAPGHSDPRPTTAPPPTHSRSTFSFSSSWYPRTGGQGARAEPPPTRGCGGARPVTRIRAAARGASGPSGVWRLKWRLMTRRAMSARP